MESVSWGTTYAKRSISSELAWTCLGFTLTGSSVPWPDTAVCSECSDLCVNMQLKVEWVCTYPYWVLSCIHTTWCTTVDRRMGFISRTETVCNTGMYIPQVSLQPLTNRSYGYLYMEIKEIKQLFSFTKQASPCEQNLKLSLSHSLSLFPALYLSLKIHT